MMDRRVFLGTAACMTAGAAFLGSPFESTAMAADSELPNIVGPKKGFAPQLGTLSSMMAFMRGQVLSSVKSLKQADLDFLLDAKANTIGALLLHLAATEALYQVITFDGRDWDTSPEKAKFEPANELGEAARKAIKGHDLDHYLTILRDTREKTLSEFKKRDDKWLFAVDEKWPWGPTNNYCKWFHVCEHEANHNGQIKFLKGRLPGASSKEGGG